MEPVRILYRDEAMAVCVKPQGAASQADGAGSMPALLEAALGVEQVWPVHRLDQAAGGVMVYGLTARAAAALSRAVQAGQLEKTYLALVRGTPDPAAGTWEDLLYHDQRRNKTFVVTRQRKGVKAARLAYGVLASDGEQSLVEVRLFTGRTHQIRVQFASRRHPLTGDGRYGGGKAPNLGLWSWKLTVPHPDTGAAMTFTCPPPARQPWNTGISAEFLQERG